MAIIQPAPTAQSRPSAASRVLTGRIAAPRRILIHGDPKIGKSTLAALAPKPLFIDCERGSAQLDVARIVPTDWADLRGIVQDTVLLAPYETIVLDTFTAAAEMGETWTLANVPNEKGVIVRNVEGYGFGKGYQYVYETLLTLLGDLNRVQKHIVLVAHSTTADVPNPNGEDFLRHEPLMQAPKSGKASIRARVIQWVDAVLFVQYDVATADGKAKGAGSRTIYASGLPTHIAGCRSVAPIPPRPWNVPTDGTIWQEVLRAAQ